MDHDLEKLFVDAFDLKTMFYTIRNMSDDDHEWLINDLLKHNTDWERYQAENWIKICMACMENVLLDEHKELPRQSGEEQFQRLKQRLPVME